MGSDMIRLVCMLALLSACAPMTPCIPDTTVWVGRAPNPGALESACADYARFTARDPVALLSGVPLLVWEREDVDEACMGGVACTIRHGEGYAIITSPGAPDIHLRHEMWHVLLYRRGVPPERHHDVMRRWVSHER